MMNLINLTDKIQMRMYATRNICRLLLSVTMIMCPGGAWAAIIKFADPKVKEICVKKWDTNKDGELSEEEAEAVTDISYAFEDQSKITSFDELEYFTGLSSIGAYAFHDCRALKSVVIPKNVRVIFSNAFGSCNSLPSLAIPDGVTRIMDNAFSCCYSLRSVPLPVGVVEIGANAFYLCKSLQSITIPKGVNSIESGVFNGCTSLKSIDIPEGVTAIGYDAFSGCTSLQSITIPEGVTAIGFNAFKGCTSLQSITIPEGVTAIGVNAFSGCESLQSIVIPSGVTAIERNTFQGCTSIHSIEIPKGIKSIDVYAFLDCKGLKDVTVGWITPLTIDADVFKGVDLHDCALHVPEGALLAYQSADVWKEFDIQADLISFADPKVKEICIRNWDTDGDGELSENEVIAITDIGQSFKGNVSITLSFNGFFVCGLIN